MKKNRNIISIYNPNLSTIEILTKLKENNQLNIISEKRFLEEKLKPRLEKIEDKLSEEEKQLIKEKNEILRNS